MPYLLTAEADVLGKLYFKNIEMQFRPKKTQEHGAGGGDDVGDGSEGSDHELLELRQSC